MKEWTMGRGATARRSGSRQVGATAWITDRGRAWVVVRMGGVPAARGSGQPLGEPVGGGATTQWGDSAVNFLHAATRAIDPSRSSRPLLLPLEIADLLLEVVVDCGCSHSKLPPARSSLPLPRSQPPPLPRSQPPPLPRSRPPLLPLEVAVLPLAVVDRGCSRPKLPPARSRPPPPLSPCSATATCRPSCSPSRAPVPGPTPARARPPLPRLPFARGLPPAVRWFL
nr:WAS/WASL-interacting protein family member 3-like [Aegilops tauschii subsp. strangulata]